MGIWGMFSDPRHRLSVFTREWLDRYQKSDLYLNDDS